MRRRVISLLAALLYLSPFLAGLSAAPISVLPIFVAAYVLWVAVMRPAIWAEATAGGTPLALAVHLAGQTLVQVLLVFLAFGIGRGLSALVGALELPDWVAVVPALSAVPLAWALGAPGDRDQQDRDRQDRDRRA